MSGAGASSIRSSPWAGSAFVGLVVFYAVGPNPWHRHAVLARLEREFTYESPGRISPRFKLTMTRRGAQS